MSLQVIKGSREAPRAQRAKMETLLVTLDEINNWRIPPFQRPIRINDKVRAISDEIKREGGIIPGIVTLGRLMPDRTLYIVDGQHRLEAGRIAALDEFIIDVRIIDFESMAEMADEFVQLNSSLVRMRPDDILRGLEASLPTLQRIRRKCPYVGYDQIRRNPKTPIIGMSALLRCWVGSAPEVPYPSPGAAASLAQGLDEGSADQLIDFLTLAHTAWGRDPAYYRLWSNINMAICMWLYRRLVVDRVRGVNRAVVLSQDQFKKCLMGLSADSDYLDWLTGRVFNDRERSPCYSRIKTIFSKRIASDTNIGKVLLPQASWASR